MNNVQSSIFYLLIFRISILYFILYFSIQISSQNANFSRIYCIYLKTKITLFYIFPPVAYITLLHLIVIGVKRFMSFFVNSCRRIHITKILIRLNNQLFRSNQT